LKSELVSAQEEISKLSTSLNQEVEVRKELEIEKENLIKSKSQETSIIEDCGHEEIIQKKEEKILQMESDLASLESEKRIAMESLNEEISKYKQENEELKKKKSEEKVDPPISSIQDLEVPSPEQIKEDQMEFLKEWLTMAFTTTQEQIDNLDDEENEVTPTDYLVLLKKVMKYTITQASLDPSERDYQEEDDEDEDEEEEEEVGEEAKEDDQEKEDQEEPENG